MMEGRRELNDTHGIWKKTSVTQEFHIQQIYPSKMKIKTFPDKQKLSTLISSRPISQEIQKEISLFRLKETPVSDLKSQEEINTQNSKYGG